MIIERNCSDFLEILASSAPVPGGGGASAFVGALGVALGSMVGNLTTGKKKYEHVQNDIKLILGKAEKLREEFIDLVEKDAKVFEPLSKAYGLPKNTDEEKKIKEEVMEKALKQACGVPLEMMEKALEAMTLHEELAEKGTRIAISDVGVGILFCKSALMGASLNVFINTKLMKDREIAETINAKAEAMILEGTAKADRIYNKVEAMIK